MTRTSDRPTVEAYAAVLFDMDGTLVDSDAAVERSWRAWAREYGVDEEQVLAVMPGHPAADTAARMRPDLDGPAVEAAARTQLEREYHDLDDVAAAPGARRPRADRGPRAPRPSLGRRDQRGHPPRGRPPRCRRHHGRGRRRPRGRRPRQAGPGGLPACRGPSRRRPARLPRRRGHRHRRRRGPRGRRAPCSARRRSSARASRSTPRTIASSRRSPNESRSAGGPLRVG